MRVMPFCGMPWTYRSVLLRTGKGDPHVSHDDVESAYPVGRDKQQLVRISLVWQCVDISDLTLGKQLQLGHVSVCYLAVLSMNAMGTMDQGVRRTLVLLLLPSGIAAAAS